MRIPVVRWLVARQALVSLILLPGIIAPLAASTPAPAAEAAAAPPAGAADTPMAGATPAPAVNAADAAAQVVALARLRLKLTPEQVEQFAPLADAQVRKIRALFEEYAGGGAALLPSFVQEFQKTRDDFRDAVRPILTDPQRAEFDRLRQEVDAAIRDIVCDQRIAALRDRLGLSLTQETDLHPIFRDDFDKKRALVSVRTAPTDGPRAKQARLEAAQKIEAGTEERLRAVLTPAQMTTYLQLRDNQGKPEDSGASDRP